MKPWLVSQVLHHSICRVTCFLKFASDKHHVFARDAVESFSSETITQLIACEEFDLKGIAHHCV